MKKFWKRSGASATGSEGDLSQQVATAFHDLRTPLSVMQTHIEVALMEGEALTGARTRRVLDVCLDEVQKMSKILKDLSARSQDKLTPP